MVPCYISGKGLHATQTTWEFKETVIEYLESCGLGYDTRFHHYRNEFPDMDIKRLARLICDPIEYYDRGWAVYWANKKDGRERDDVLTEYMWHLDERFQAESRVGIVCFDEAGLGTGINAMRFLTRNKPLLGFYNMSLRRFGVNVSNILQLKLEFPGLVTLHQYQTQEEVRKVVGDWLKIQNNN